MMNITSNETTNNPKDTDNLSHNKKKGKISTDEIYNKNDKKKSDNQVNNSRNYDPIITFDDINMINLILRKIKHGAEVTSKINKYTTLITFEFTVSRDNKQLNIFDRHKKIFEAMKLVDNSTKIITTADKVLSALKRPLRSGICHSYSIHEQHPKETQGLCLLQSRI